MTLVLDAGGVTSLAQRRDLVFAFREHGAWPPLVPAVVLVEVLTGDHRKDHAVGRFLRLCPVLPVDETLARSAAALRTATGRAGSISAVDAVVAATAEAQPDPLVLTSDPRDLRSLATAGHTGFAVRAV